MRIPGAMVTVHCLGVGLVGSYVAKKLVDSGFNVHAYDPYPDRVTGIDRIETHRLGPEEDPVNLIMRLISSPDGIDFDPNKDIVVNMLPGDIGHTSTSALAELPWRVVDLSFSQFTPDRDHAKAKNSGSTILWDTGIAPGLSNMLLSLAYKEMGDLRNGVVRVGGNPTIPSSGWNYMAPFSPIDVIAEYTRPARVIRNSKVVTVPALSERHDIEVSEKGTMEAFLTDGLRSLLSTIPAVELSEYTVRWPGHIQRYIDERDAGNLDINTLTKEWRYNDEVEEFTWMEVIAESMDGKKMSWYVQDHGGTDGHSMARATGLVTVCCVEEWIDCPDMLPSGVHPPESLPPDVVNRIISRMIQEGVEITGPSINIL